MEKILEAFNCLDVIEQGPLEILAVLCFCFGIILLCHGAHRIWMKCVSPNRRYKIDEAGKKFIGKPIGYILLTGVGLSFIYCAYRIVRAIYYGIICYVEAGV